MGFFFFLLTMIPVVWLAGYLLIGYPYGNRVTKEIDKMMKNDKLMDKMEHVIHHQLERVDKGTFIVYQPKKKIKHLPIKIIHRPPAVWEVIINSPFNFGYLEVVYENGKIRNIYGDSVDRHKLIEEYITLYQKRFVEIIEKLEEKESKVSNVQYGQGSKDSLPQLKELFYEIQNGIFIERQIYTRGVGRFQVKFTVDDKFVVLKIYYLGSLIYDACCHQGTDKIEVTKENPQPITPDMWEYFKQEVVPEAEEFMKHVNEESEEKVIWEKKIEEKLSKVENEEIKNEYEEVKSMYEQMDKKHQKDAEELYKKTLEKLYNEITITIKKYED